MKLSVCRTCLAFESQLIDMEQTVPYSELMTYNDILSFCTGSVKPFHSDQESEALLGYICLRCSKALQVSYYFLKLVFCTDAVLQSQQLMVAHALAAAGPAATFEEAAADELENKVTVVLEQTANTIQEDVKYHATMEGDDMKKDIKTEIENLSAEYNMVDTPSMATESSQTGGKVLTPNNSMSNNMLDIIKTDLNDYLIFGDCLSTDISTNIVNSKNIPTGEIDGSILRDFVESKQNEKKSNDDNSDSGFSASKRCKIDNETFEITKQSSSSDEIAERTNHNFYCNQCNMKFNDFKAFTRHKNEHTGITPLRCQHCQFFSCYPESLRKHYKKLHTIEVNDEILNASIDPPEEKDYHEITYKCYKCTRESHNQNDIQDHLLEEHYIDEEDDIDSLIVTIFNCPQCARKFRDLRGMRIHFIYAHGKRHSSKQSEQSTQLFKCLKCEKEFSQKGLVTHQRSCESPQPIHCNLCAKDHNSVRQFEQHLCTEHAVEMIHECEFCGKSFKNSRSLSTHRKRHTERNFQCDRCPKNYINQGELDVHIHRIHNTQTQMTCRICGDNFASVGSLRAHESKTHFRKLHKCNICSHKCTTYSGLKRHQYEHTGMPYKCTLCPKAFAGRRFIRHHTLRVHGISIADHELADMFRKNMGYPSRYDVFSSVTNLRSSRI